MPVHEVSATNDPGSQLDYVEFTANVACTAITAAAANTIVTGSSISFNGATPVLIQFFAQSWDCSVTANNCHIELYEDGVDIGRIFVSRDAIASGRMLPIFAVRRMTPAAGVRTYSIRGWISSSGTFTVYGGVGGAAVDMPGYIRIERA